MTRHAMPARRGRFITIEGPEGSGKSTMAARLREDLAGRGVAAILTREPGGTVIGEGIRALLLARADGAVPTEVADAFLFNAARAQLVAEVVRPALDRGDVVICARFADSTIAYQGYGAGLPVARLRQLESFATDGLKPDLTFLLDVPPKVGLARKAGDEINRFEATLDFGFHERVRDGFMSLAVDEPERFIVIDATLPADTVYSAMIGAVTKHLSEFTSASPPGLGGRGGHRASEPAQPAVRTTR